MSPEIFAAAVEKQIDAFEDNGLLRKVKLGDIEMADYQRLLGLLFHQVRSSSTTFAMAAIHMPWAQWRAKEYLFMHAHEESSHWRWILGDLLAIGQCGASPDETPPAPQVMAYVEFNERTAVELPLGRLAIAAVLEGIGGRLSERYIATAAKRLRLQPNQMQFFAGHAGTDVVHSKEITEVLAASVNESQEWAPLIQVANQAGQLYRAIYELAAATDR